MSWTSKRGDAKAEEWNKLSLVDKLLKDQGMWFSSKHNINHPRQTMIEAAERIMQLEKITQDLIK